MLDFKVPEQQPFILNGCCSSFQLADSNTRAAA